MASWFQVLIVSSDAVLRNQLTAILVTLGIDPVQLSTLGECRELLAHKRPGLVFCDARLADGTYQDLLAGYPVSDNKPRAVITSRTADWDEFKEAMRYGAFDVISAPCRRSEVEWMVVQAKRAEHQARELAQLESLELEKAGA
jgi:DNA-binding NtrC family response regulator